MTELERKVFPAKSHSRNYANSVDQAYERILHFQIPDILLAMSAEEIPRLTELNKIFEES
jgi:hypothetical protein